MRIKIQHRRDTAANWTAANPVLAAGEPAYETDTGKEKIGDGTTAWAALAYTGTEVLAAVATTGAYADLTGTPTIPAAYTDAQASAAAPVQSVAGRAGAVTLAKGDVGLSAVTNVDATQRANHTGTQSAATITGLAPVATSGVYTDLTGKPTIPAATTSATDLTSGTLAVARIADGSITAAKVAADVATQAELDAHAGDTANPHAVTKAQVGLGSVDNTADTAKPVSTAQATAITGAVLTETTRATAAEALKAPIPDIQVFTASGTWTKPAGVTTVTAYVIGGGNGGGGGGATVSGTASSGGSGGGGGGATIRTLLATACGSTETVSVGAGGAGGAAVVGTGVGTVAGQNGAAGTGSSFGLLAKTTASGAGGTGGGTGAAGANNGGTGQTIGNPSASAPVGATSPATVNAAGTGAGGAGGGVTAAPAAKAGGVGGLSTLTGLTAAAGGAINSAGPNGPNAATGDPGGGGAGGGSSVTGNGGAGGAGGNYGAGGGGGGSVIGTNTSGAGGNGGPGIVVVIST